MILRSAVIKTLTLETFFIPSEVNNSTSVCILIDAIRASCTITTFFDKNCSQILLTEDEQKSLMLDKSINRDDYCICAEKIDGSKSDVAHVSPSLAKIQHYSFPSNGKVLFRTTNGTKGIFSLQKNRNNTIFIGSMLNRNAVVKHAIEEASRQNCSLKIVCAGRGNGEIYCIDDTYCSGKLVESAIAMAEGMGIVIDLQDSAKIALLSLNNFKNTVDAFSKSASGEIMRKVGNEVDIELCAQDNISTTVPQVKGLDEFGHIVIEKVILEKNKG